MIMATISENLQTIADSTAAIKQAIIDKGGTIEGDITTWASAISGIETGGGSELLTFTLNNFVFFFQDGMTWDEYINITNPNNVGMSYDHVYKSSTDNYVHIFAQSVLVLNESLVYLTDTILPQVYSSQQRNSGGAD
jgi:hypothetical protein